MKTSCLDVADLYQFAKAGFVVIASDYRYQGPTVKRDQWGGVEVDDVLNLVPALKSLDFVDSDRLYMLGLSRGGTMAYLAIKRGIPIKAAAVIGGVTDVKAWVDESAEMGIVNGNEYIDGFAKIWPDYERRAEEEYRVAGRELSIGPTRSMCLSSSSTAGPTEWSRSSKLSAWQKHFRKGIRCTPFTFTNATGIPYR